MIDDKKQKEINILLSKIDILQERNNFLYHQLYDGENIYFKSTNEIDSNYGKIKPLKAKVSKLYITYSK